MGVAHLHYDWPALRSRGVASVIVVFHVNLWGPVVSGLVNGGAGGKLRLQTALGGPAADGLCRLARITFQSNVYGFVTSTSEYF